MSEADVLAVQAASRRASHDDVTRLAPARDKGASKEHRHRNSLVAVTESSKEPSTESSSHPPVEALVQASRRGSRRRPSVLSQQAAVMQSLSGEPETPWPVTTSQSVPPTVIATNTELTPLTTKARSYSLPVPVPPARPAPGLPSHGSYRSRVSRDCCVP